MVTPFISSGAMQDITSALRMIDVFASVGATHFDLTHTNIDGEKRGFRPSQSVVQIKTSMPKLFPGALARHNNIIVRPISETTAIIQLDDLDNDKLQRVGEVAFLTLQTSPGNHQAWVAVSGLPTTQPEAKDFARRLRKGTGADATASGATRVAGSLNYKRKYEPQFPTVQIESAQPGRVVAAKEIMDAGLLSPEEVHQPFIPNPARVSRRNEASIRARKWPDYERCLQGAPPNHGNSGPDISRADFAWCMTALDWGFDTQETSSKLLELSDKAKENGERYARLTVQNAASAVENRSQRSRGSSPKTLR